MTGFREILWGASRASGLCRAWRLRNRRRVPILMYHAITPVDDPVARWTHLPVDRLEWQLEYLAERYRVLQLSEVVAAFQAGRSLPPATAVLTFDDGFRSVATLAAPILQRLGLPATVFLTTQFVDTGRLLWTSRLYLRFRATIATSVQVPEIQNEPFALGDLHERDRASDQIRQALKRLPDRTRRAVIERLEAELELSHAPPTKHFAPLSWGDARALNRTGGFEFGAHSVSHPILSRVGTEQMRTEVRDSCQIVRERLGIQKIAFAYPNGGPDDFDAATQDAVRDASAFCGLTTINGLCSESDDLYSLRRLGVGASTSRAEFAAMCSGLHHSIQQGLGRA